MTRQRLTSLRSSSRHERGFSLLEMGITMALFGIVMATVLVGTATFNSGKKERQLADTLEKVERALVAYAGINRRLPCPADAQEAGPDRGLAVGYDKEEPDDCDDHQKKGVVPWRTLGLSQDDVMDPYNHMLTYRVNPALAAPDGANLATCEDLNTCIADLDGLSIRTEDSRDNDSDRDLLAGRDRSNGAAFVLISHGPNGRCSAPPTPVGDSDFPFDCPGPQIVNPDGQPVVNDMERCNSVDAEYNPIHKNVPGTCAEADGDWYYTGPETDDTVLFRSNFWVIREAALLPSQKSE